MLYLTLRELYTKDIINGVTTLPILASFLALLLIFMFSALNAETTPSSDEMEQWFMSDEITPPTQSSDSQLKFITAQAGKPTLHSVNKITIHSQSMQTGWVDLMQCYQHLDPVPEMEVVYNYKDIRELKIINHNNIDKAYVRGQSIQLENIINNAQLCISCEVRILYKNKDGSYKLVNGPFHRQFLDSYFPFHLTLKVNYPSIQLKFIDSKPKSQAGFKLKQTYNNLLIDSYFTGKLYTEIFFKAVGNN